MSPRQGQGSRTNSIVRDEACTPGSRWPRDARRLVTVVACLALPGCAYYNGLYNAKDEFKAGDRLARAGREAEATGRYATAALKADTVLARFPKSRWRTDALLISARAHALAGECAQAAPRLDEASRLATLDQAARERLQVAAAVCDVRLARPQRALDALVPIAERGRAEVRPAAALWAARAAMALGDADRARAILGAVDAGAAQWELAQASLAAHQWAVAESLLVQRAARGDVRPEATAMLRTLWLNGQREAVQRLATRWGQSSARASDKLALHGLVADLQMAAGLDEQARAHLLAVRRLAADSVTDADAATRLALLALAPLTRAEDVAAVVRRNAATGRAAPLQQRLEDNVRLVERLAARPDASGASLYLAAEIARDSLRAPRYAYQLFRRIDQTVQGAVLAPRGLHAAALLVPDSAPMLHARLRDRYPRSPWTVALDGASPGELPAFEAAEAALRLTWAEVAVAYADSLRKVRAMPGSADAPKRPVRPPRKPKVAQPATAGAKP